MCRMCGLENVSEKRGLVFCVLWTIYTVALLERIQPLIDEAVDRRLDEKMTADQGESVT